MMLSTPHRTLSALSQLNPRGRCWKERKPPSGPPASSSCVPLGSSCCVLSIPPLGICSLKLRYHNMWSFKALFFFGDFACWEFQILRISSGNTTFELRGCSWERRQDFEVVLLPLSQQWSPATFNSDCLKRMIGTKSERTPWEQEHESIRWRLNMNTCCWSRQIPGRTSLSPDLSMPKSCLYFLD